LNQYSEYSLGPLSPSQWSKSTQRLIESGFCPMNRKLNKVLNTSPARRRLASFTVLPRPWNRCPSTTAVIRTAPPRRHWNDLRFGLPSSSSASPAVPRWYWMFGRRSLSTATGFHHRRHGDGGQSSGTSVGADDSSNWQAQDKYRRRFAPNASDICPGIAS